MVWNPVTGCTPCSEGCKNCYAMAMQKRLKGIPATELKYRTFKPTFHKDDIKKPYHWKKPSKIFTVSMGDLFHEDVPFAWIDVIFKVIEDNPRHRYIMLTKRPAVALEYFTSREISPVALSAVWLGVSVENQAAADQRIPLLLKVPSVGLKIVSAEPLIAPVDLSGYIKGLGWVIVGGETGGRSRPMLRAWAEAIERQCSKAKVPFFFKSWGDFRDIDDFNYTLTKQDINRKFTTVTVDYLGQRYYLKRIGKKWAGDVLYGGGANTSQVPRWEPLEPDLFNGQ